MSQQTQLLIPRNKSLVSLDEQEINQKIIEERNIEVQKIAEDMEHISDINLSLRELVYEQSESIEQAVENVSQAEQNVFDATEHLQQAEEYQKRSIFKGIFAKGALVSTGVTGAGAAAGFLLNPLAGGVAVIVGISGVVFCIAQMNRN